LIYIEKRCKFGLGGYRIGRMRRTFSAIAVGVPLAVTSSEKRLVPFAVLAVLLVATAMTAGCGSSKPKETFKQAQAAVVIPYERLLKVLQRSAATGVDMTAAEERATDQLIATVNQHRPALGLHEAKRSLSVTAYTLNKLGNMCPACQQKLQTAEASLK
jgi:hypothetical protein